MKRSYSASLVDHMALVLLSVLAAVLVLPFASASSSGASSSSAGTVFAFGQFYAPGFFGLYPTGAIYLTSDGTPPPLPSNVTTGPQPVASDNLFENKWGVFPVSDIASQNFVDLVPVRRLASAMPSASNATFYLATHTTMENIPGTPASYNTYDRSSLYLLEDGPVANRVLTFPVGEHISFMASSPASSAHLYLGGDFMTIDPALIATTSTSSSGGGDHFDSNSNNDLKLNHVSLFDGKKVIPLGGGIPECTTMTGLVHLPLEADRNVFDFHDSNFLFVSCSDSKSRGLYAWNGTRWRNPLTLFDDNQVEVHAIAYESAGKNLWFSAKLKNVFFGYLNVVTGDVTLLYNSTQTSSLAHCICPHGSKELFVGTSGDGLKRYDRLSNKWYDEAAYRVTQCLVVDDEQVIVAGYVRFDQQRLAENAVYRRNLRGDKAHWEKADFGIHITEMRTLRYLRQFPVIDGSTDTAVDVSSMTVVILVEAFFGLMSLVITFIVFASLLWVTIFGFEGSCVQALSAKLKFLGIELPSEYAKKTNVTILNESIAEQERRISNQLASKTVNIASRGFFIQNMIGWIFVLLVLILAIIPQQLAMFFIIFVPSGLFPMVCIILGMIPVDFKQRWHQLLAYCPLWALSMCLHLVIGTVYLGTIIAALIVWAYGYVIYDYWVTVLLLFGLFIFGFLVYEAMMLRSGIRMLKESLRQTYEDDWIRKGLQIMSVVTIIWTFVIAVGSLLVNGFMTTIIFNVLHSSLVQMLYSTLDGTILKLCLVITGAVMFIVLIDILSAVWRIFNVYIMRRSARNSETSVRITMHSAKLSYGLAAFHIVGFLVMLLLQLLYLLLVFIDFLSPARDLDVRRLRFMAAYWIAPFVAMNIFHLALAGINIGMRVLSRKRIEHQRLYEEDIDLFVVDDEEIKHEL